jgi:hypothetical protein
MNVAPAQLVTIHRLFNHAVSTTEVVIGGRTLSQHLPGQASVGMLDILANTETEYPRIHYHHIDLFKEHGGYKRKQCDCPVMLSVSGDAVSGLNSSSTGSQSYDRMFLNEACFQ